MECLWDCLAMTQASDMGCKIENPASGILFDVLPSPFQALDVCGRGCSRREMVWQHERMLK